MKKQQNYNVSNLGFANINIYFDGFPIMGYYTVVLSKENKIIDLQYINRKLSTDNTPNGYSYIIEYLEPMKNFEKNKIILTRKEALKSLKQHLNSFHKNMMDNYEILVVQK